MQHSAYGHLAFMSVAILVSTLAAFGLAQGASPTPGFIELHGQGVNGASVYLGTKSIGTIKDNSLLVPNVYPGHYTLRIELKPYLPREVPITVPAGHGVAITVGVQSISVNEQAEQSATNALTLAPTSASVHLSCYPMECELKIARAEANDTLPPLPRTTFDEHFGQDAILVTGLPQGDYTFTVTTTSQDKTKNKTLEATQGLCNGDSLDLVADFNATLGGLSFGLTSYPNCKPLTVQSPKP